MPRAPSRYEQYWQLLKEHRGCVLELNVPDEFHERIIKALKKRKTIEHSKGSKFYPDFSFTKNPIVKGKRLSGVLHVVLPDDPMDTI